MGAIRPDQDMAVWWSQAQYYSSTGHSHNVEIYTSCQIVPIARYSCVSEPISSRDCSILSYNISINKILGQTT